MHEFEPGPSWARSNWPLAELDPVNAGLDPGVVCAQHGWWQGCDELDLPPSDPFELEGHNLNLVLRQTPSDPVSGSQPLRASLCDVARV